MDGALRQPPLRHALERIVCRRMTRKVKQYLVFDRYLASTLDTTGHGAMNAGFVPTGKAPIFTGSEFPTG